MGSVATEIPHDDEKRQRSRTLGGRVAAAAAP
jgi:hypothetical protein